MDLSPDTLLRSRYRIIRPLGKGGMGAVYLAFDNSLELEVAVKYNQNASEEATSQFLREARILAALRQPNLPRVIDYFIEGQDQYLVMDFVPGDTFDDILEKEGPQPLELVLKWTQQLVDALSYLHAQTPPITHRDIKPANIKVTPDGQVMLVDFGIAKIAETAQMTATGARGYTTGYAPPEQYGSARTGPYSDQYSLAATLYKLLSNQKPTDGVQRALGEAVLTPLNLLNPNVPAHVVEAIEKAMSPRIQERYESVNAFLQALTDPNFSPEMPHLETVHRPASAPSDTEPQKKKSKSWGVGAACRRRSGHDCRPRRRLFHPARDGRRPLCQPHGNAHGRVNPCRCGCRSRGHKHPRAAHPDPAADLHPISHRRPRHAHA